MATKVGTRLALVTGAGSGIGRAVCQRFAKEGILVVAIDQNHEDAKNTISTLEPAVSGHQSIECNVTSQKDVNVTVENLFKNLDRSITNIALVNSAGITRDASFLKMSVDQWDSVLDVNLKGTFITTQAICRAMVTHKLPGSIVNISSLAAKGGNIGQANYAASKSGVVGFTKTVAKEMARSGIRCNAVLPGMIATPMVKTIPDKIHSRVIQMTPLGRIGQPEDIADACYFLASDNSKFITGTALEVTGGLDM
eukprot:CFRG4416T1